MAIDPQARLAAFQRENRVHTKGPLSLVIQFTRSARDKRFPLSPEAKVRWPVWAAAI